MNVKYHISYSTSQPKAIEIYGNTVYLRKNFSKTVHKQVNADGSEAEIENWTYEEAILTVDEFNAYTDFLEKQNAINGINDSENILKVLTSQDASSFNQLAIMEAFADLYELLLLNSSQ